MSKIVSHTPVEIETLRRLQDAGGFTDVVRDQIPEPVKLASWWSYRAKDFRESNRGLRLDHLWTSPGLTPAVVKGSAPHPRRRARMGTAQRPRAGRDGPGRLERFR